MDIFIYGYIHNLYDGVLAFDFECINDEPVCFFQHDTHNCVCALLQIGKIT